jgi:uncharacterized protein YabE (DUF348 family)/3D (Asp-Asp-Asp) domain-containing protein
MPDMFEKHGFYLFIGSIFLGLGLIGVWLLTSNPDAGKTTNTILVRTTGGLPPVVSAEVEPGNILREAGIQVNPGDQILVDGQRYLPDQPLLPAQNRVIQLIPSSRITLHQNGAEQTFLSSAPTLGQALWEAGYRLASTDRVEPPLDSLLVGDTQVTLQSARTITVVDGEKTIQIHTSAATVEAALAESGFSLTALDNTTPPGNEPVQAGGIIKINRNSEELILSNKVLVFENEQVYKEDMAQGASEVIQNGENGVELTRERILYSNGKETGRRSEGVVIIKEPVKQITNVGSQPVARAVDIGPESLDYYRTETVYITSYSPCRQGYDHCSTGTASGTPLAKGVIAVTQAWYRIFAGTQIYIPGYGIGTVADTGGGMKDRYWIDVGYGEEDFVNWHQYVTVYFLNPAPANVPEVLP